MLRNKLRGQIKGAVGVAVATAVLAVLKRTRVRAGLALYYHKIGDPPGAPSLELVPAMGAGLFESQLRYLQDHYEIVRARDLLPAVATRRRGQRFPLAVTIDDDLASHRAVAAPVLARLGLPATFFLCGASLDTPFAFWWEYLDDASKRHGEGNLPALTGLAAPTPRNPRHGARLKATAVAIEAMTKADRRVVSKRIEAETVSPVPHAGMPSADLRVLVAAGHDIGFHTRYHDPLPTLSDAELAEAVLVGRAELEEVVGYPIDLIAYPHGRFDHRTTRAAENAGYSTGFSTNRVAVTDDSDRLALGRFEAPFGSVGELAWMLGLALLRQSWPLRQRRRGT